MTSTINSVLHQRDYLFVPSTLNLPPLLVHPTETVGRLKHCRLPLRFLPLPLTLAAIVVRTLLEITALRKVANKFLAGILKSSNKKQV